MSITVKNSLTMTFLGAGNAFARPDMGSSSAYLSINGEPSLLIDMGPDIFFQAKDTFYEQRFPALFITHLHFDHVGGLERLFYDRILKVSDLGKIRLYVPCQLVARMTQMFSATGSHLSEGGVNFWDAFDLIPVSDTFFHDGYRFTVFPVRHQLAGESYGLSLPGRFFYSGDTRPVPDLLVQHASSEEVIFHDSGVNGNPAHTGIDDIEREYHFQPSYRARLVLYHMPTRKDAEIALNRGYRVALPGSNYKL